MQPSSPGMSLDDGFGVDIALRNDVDMPYVPLETTFFTSSDDMELSDPSQKMETPMQGLTLNLTNPQGVVHSATEINSLLLVPECNLNGVIGQRVPFHEGAQNPSDTAVAADPITCPSHSCSQSPSGGVSKTEQVISQYYSGTMPVVNRAVYLSGKPQVASRYPNKACAQLDKSSNSTSADKNDVKLKTLSMGQPIESIKKDQEQPAQIALLSERIGINSETGSVQIKKFDETNKSVRKANISSTSARNSIKPAVGIEGTKTSVPLSSSASDHRHTFRPLSGCHQRSSSPIFDHTSLSTSHKSNQKGSSNPVQTECNVSPQPNTQINTRPTVRPAQNLEKVIEASTKLLHLYNLQRSELRAARSHITKLEGDVHRLESDNSKLRKTAAFNIENQESSRQEKSCLHVKPDVLVLDACATPVSEICGNRSISDDAMTVSDECTRDDLEAFSTKKRRLEKDFEQNSGASISTMQHLENPTNS